MIVPEECVSDKHESPHFANLYDMAVKYADVLPVAEVAGLHGAVPAGELRQESPSSRPKWRDLLMQPLPSE